MRRVFRSSAAEKFRHSHQAKILLATVICILALGAIRAVYLCSSYPEEDVPIEDLFGTGNANLKNLDVNGHELTATDNNTQILYELAEPIPVHEVRYDVSNLSRENCRAYITLEGTGEESSVLMAEGRNYITFGHSSPKDQVTALNMLPVTLRAVHFDYSRYIINPHGHFIATSVRMALFVLVAAVFLELVLFSLALAWKKNAHTKATLPVLILLGALQCVHAGMFLYLFFTRHWQGFTMAYFLMIYLSASAMLLMVCRPDRRLTVFYRTGKKQKPTHTTSTLRRELPGLRIALLSLLNFCCCEALYSDQFKLDKPIAIFGNLLIFAMPYLLLWCITPSRHLRRFTYTIPMAIWLVVSVVNHYYFEYRSQAFEYSDLTMASTFRNVAGNYRLDLVPELFLVYAAYACVIIALSFESRSIYRRKSWKSITPAAAVLVFSLIWVPVNAPYVSLWNTNTATKHNGYAFSYISYAKKSLEKPTPRGYSAKETEALLDSFRTKETKENDGAVNIIVMMDEAFADLPDTYGFETDNDVMPYIHSLSGDNVRRGKMMVSVFGGTTADTEYEFLTGNSLSFLNGEAVPYTQYINSDQESLARLLSSRGYSATAFHPFLASGYKRYKVYPLLGFDEFLASDNTSLPYTAKMRSYISDMSDVQDVIDIYENREKYGVTTDTGEPFFLFNVTMQNHGGYNAQVPAVDVTVAPTDPELAKLSELKEYLSLARATDDAFRTLTEYFSKVKEKTIILMFGDHQPGMGEYVYQAMDPKMYEENASLEEREKKYTVPYTMWANYDLTSEELPVTSPNFLRSYLLENAGLSLSAYDNFVSSVRAEYPAMNRLGFLDKDGKWNDVTEIDNTPKLMDYKKAAYYNLFDHHKVDDTLFQ